MCTKARHTLECTERPTQKPSVPLTSMSSRVRFLPPGIPSHPPLLSRARAPSGTSHPFPTVCPARSVTRRLLSGVAQHKTCREACCLPSSCKTNLVNKCPGFALKINLYSDHSQCDYRRPSWSHISFSWDYCRSPSWGPMLHSPLSSQSAPLWAGPCPCSLGLPSLLEQNSKCILATTRLPLPPPSPVCNPPGTLLSLLLQIHHFSCLCTYCSRCLECSSLSETFRGLTCPPPSGRCSHVPSSEKPS